MRTLLSFLMLALLTAAPLAMAQEETKPEESPERPDDAAWAEDCPPDMMCAFGGSAEETPEDQPTYDGNCGGEVCAYGDEDCIECSGPVDEPRDGGAEPGQALGPEDCIDCMRPPADQGSNCMDGEQEGESCLDDVQYIGGPTRGPSDGSCENCRGEEAEPISAPVDQPKTQSAAKSNVPAPTVAVALLALAAMAVLVLPRRK